MWTVIGKRLLKENTTISYVSHDIWNLGMHCSFSFINTTQGFVNISLQAWERYSDKQNKYISFLTIMHNKNFVMEAEMFDI